VDDRTPVLAFASQQSQTRLLSTTQDDDSALAKARSEPDDRARIAAHEQHRLVPSMQRSFGFHHHEPP
jgi:hypothetical protein